MTKSLWLRLDNGLQWAKVSGLEQWGGTRVALPKAWSLTGSGRARRCHGAALPSCLVSKRLMQPAPLQKPSPGTVVPCVLFPWKGHVSLVLSLFIRQMTDASWAQALFPALFLGWSLSLSPVEGSPVFMLVCLLVWPVWHLHLDVSQTAQFHMCLEPL